MKKQKIYFLSEFKDKNPRISQTKNYHSKYTERKYYNINIKEEEKEEEVSTFNDCNFYIIDGVEVKEGESYYNIDEINIIETILKKLNKFINVHIKNKTIKIGIFSPYKSQVKKIKTKCNKTSIKIFKMKFRKIDKIKKNEKFDVVIISLVRTTYEEIPILNNPKIINKVFDSSKYLKFILGNINFISSNTNLRNLYNYLNNRDCVHEYK